MSGQVYHWQDDAGAWQLGRKVNPPWYVFDNTDEKVAVRLLYAPPTSPDVWVPESKLRPYPESKIEEPTK